MTHFPRSPVTMFLLPLAVTGVTGCGGEQDLPPAERLARFQAFAKEGMTWQQITDEFEPDRFSLGLADPDDPTKHLGGTYPADYSTSKLKQAFADHPNYDGFTLTYDWSDDPLVYTDVSFTKEGTCDHISQTGDFDD